MKIFIIIIINFKKPIGKKSQVIYGLRVL